jgi:hypothetical protein
MYEENENSLISALTDIKRTQVDEEEVARFTSEDEFIGLSVSLLVEAGSFACLAAGTIGHARAWDRDRAVVGGNVVRLYKVVSAMLDQTVQRRRETSFVFARLGFETVVSIRYLIKHFCPELVESYIKNSFKHEVRLREKIEKNISARSGLVTPIEDRMMKSIDRAFASAGLEPADLKEYRERNWGGKNLYDKAVDLGLEDAYLGAFAGPSHSIHGAWGDIYSHSLRTEGDGEFLPNLKWGYPRPQLLGAMAKLTITAVDDFFGFIAGSEIQGLAREKLYDLYQRIETLDEAHESYLAAKVWPKI